MEPETGLSLMTSKFPSLLPCSLARSITGQLLFKLSVNESDESRRRRGRFLPVFASGIFAMTIGFFAWLTLLSKFELSFVYPFEALSRLMLIAGAIVFLKEKMTARLWIGAIFITSGIIIVSATHG